MKNYSNAFSEVYTILKYLDENERGKIPQIVLKIIEKNRNIEYEYRINEELNLKNKKCYLKQKLYYLIFLEII